MIYNIVINDDKNLLLDDKKNLKNLALKLTDMVKTYTKDIDPSVELLKLNKIGYIINLEDNKDVIYTQTWFQFKINEDIENVFIDFTSTIPLDRIDIRLNFELIDNFEITTINYPSDFKFGKKLHDKLSKKEGVYNFG